MYQCTFDADYPQGKTECSGVHWEESNGILLPRAWLNPPYHFDDFPQASLSVFRINTLKLLEIMLPSSDKLHMRSGSRLSVGVKFRSTVRTLKFVLLIGVLSVITGLILSM